MLYTLRNEIPIRKADAGPKIEAVETAVALLYLLVVNAAVPAAELPLEQLAENPVCSTLSVLMNKICKLVPGVLTYGVVRFT